ncbi:MAG: universal stress protein [Chloroflexi bacterium]|nr:universal stress protein [Chloroflexota bacterium]
MSAKSLKYQNALKNFREARQRAALQEVLARLTGKSDELLSYDLVVQKLQLSARTERGVQAIPVDAIVGSVDRYSDFTRTFLPRHDNDRERWARVQTVFSTDGGVNLPAIDVYKIGDVYFVSDGNHRVSVARQQGIQYIEANVIEVQTDVPLTPDIQPDDLIVKAEYAEFLKQTRLTELRPNVDLSLTVPGQYQKLNEQIEIHRYLMQQNQGNKVSYQQAVEDWYDQVYTPLATAIHDHGLLRWFPNRTATDLYLWVSEHREGLEKELGWTVRPEAAVTDLAVKESTRAESQVISSGSWRKARTPDRYTDQLFMDILVPLNGTPTSWQALEQAILVAHREGARLHGLYIAASDALKNSPEALTIQTRFNERCAADGIAGSLTIEAGNITQRICERALLTDLIVLNVAHPPAAGLQSLSSGLRTIIARSARPLLTVPALPSRLDHAILAFDGSPKSKEALFVAAYLAERWKTALTVLSIQQGSKQLPSALDYAHEYLELHEVQTEFEVVDGPMDILPRLIDECQSEECHFDLVLMGGYSGSPLKQIVAGSTVNWMLREAHCPLFICH